MSIYKCRGNDWVKRWLFGKIRQESSVDVSSEMSKSLMSSHIYVFAKFHPRSTLEWHRGKN